MWRREVLRALGLSTGAGLLASCVTAPIGVATPTSPAPTAAPPPTAASTRVTTVTPTPPATATGVPTATATGVPTATTTRAPIATATAVPTAVPTAATPAALAAAVDNAMERAIQSGALPGGVALVQHRGVRLMLAAYGLSHKYDSLSTLTAEPIPVTTDTLYDLASITKVFTTTCALRLVEGGRLALDELVAARVPEFAAGEKESVTLRQLLTHTSGLPDLLELWHLADTPAARLQRVLETPLLDPPGSVFRYSDLGLIVVGHLLERVTGVSLDTLVRALLTDPLGLQQVTFRPAAGFKSRIAPTEDEQDPARGLVWGEVEDANAWSLGGVAGHAGLFGRAADIGRFAQLYLDGGTGGGTRLLEAETVAEMTRNQIGGLGWRGLGWELNASYYMGRLASPRTFGHTGFAGTSVVIDPTRELIVVLLTNRVHPTRDGPSINATRQAVANAALAAVDAG